MAEPDGGPDDQQLILSGISSRLQDLPRDTAPPPQPPLDDATARRQAETAFRAIQLQLKTILEGLPLALVTLGRDGCVQTWNPAAERLFGWTAAEVLGQPLPIVPDGKRQEFQALLVDTLRGRQYDGLELRRRRKDGTTLDVSLWTAPLLDDQGAIAGTIGFFADISARKQAEAALATRTRHLEAVRSVSEEITHELDLTRLLRLLIARAADLVGASAATLYLWEPAQGMVVPAAWHGLGDWQATIRHRLGQGIAGTVAQSRQGLCVNDYRTSRYANPVTLQHTQLTASLGEPLLYREELIGAITLSHDGGRVFTAQDQELLRLFATQAAIAIENARLFQGEQGRRQELEAVQEVTEELARELDLTALLRLIYDRAVKLVRGDSGTIYLWDEDVQALVPKGWHGHGDWMADLRLRSGEGVAGSVAARRQGLIVNDFRTSPYALPAFLQLSSHVAVLAEPLLYRERLVGVLSVNREDPARPFTIQDQRLVRLFATQAAIAIENARLFQDQQRSYRELQQAQEELVRTEKLRALGQMAAGIAHDLNNMLAAVLGQAELLRLRARDPETLESLHTLETAATDGAQVVRRLQDFGRRRGLLPLVPVELAAVVAEALEITRPRWRDESQRQGLTIRVQTHLEGLPPILGHAAELRQALTNLILNAVDAMPQGGVLRFAGRAAQGGPGEGVELEVADTGVGMSEPILQRVFDPFYSTKGLQGTGLGLSVVYGILERHGGRIHVASTPGRGTTFTLRFQIAPPDGPETGRPAAASPGSRRILLIDDDLAVRETVASLLRATGHSVLEASDGPAGLARLGEGAVDLVITDLGMPEMTGWEVAQAVKAQRPGVPVVLLTGWGDGVAPDTPEVNVVDRILGKPVRLSELLPAIAALSPGGSPPTTGS